MICQQSLRRWYDQMIWLLLWGQVRLINMVQKLLALLEEGLQ